MKRFGWFPRALAALACCGMAMPQLAMAAPAGAVSHSTTQSGTGVADVTLQAGGVLVGEVIDQQGQPLVGVPVSLWQQQRQVAATTADDTGRFTVSGLKGGVYQVAAGDTVLSYRLWAHRTAPPAASASALVVCGGVVRGQGGVARFLTNPWVLAGLVGAAIAIPIALSNNDDEDGS